MLGLDTWQWTLLVVLILLCSNYIIHVGLDRLSSTQLTLDDDYFYVKEGFTNDKDKDNDKGKTDNESLKSRYEWLTDDDIYDDFYVSIFNKLTMQHELMQGEVEVIMDEWTKAMKPSQMTILDVGSGTGVATVGFAKKDVNAVVGIDKSPAMIRYAKNKTLSTSTLTHKQKELVEFRQMDLLGPGSASGAEFTHAFISYFTIYYFKDLDAIFRNLHLWVRPGGSLAIEVVNKHRFEPVLDSANPWFGTTPQKHAKERITKSNVVFDKFEYESNFDLEDPKAEFREVFRFKDGSVRRQKHTLWMPSIKDIIHRASLAGWTYTKYIDLLPIGFPYGYLIIFSHN
jgi:SAM-dependent methyltransferase